MMDMKKKTDMDLLDQIIAMAEDSMIRPMSKKKSIAIEVEPEEDESGSPMEMKDHESGESMGEKEGEGELSEDDLQALIEEYKNSKRA